MARLAPLLPPLLAAVALLGAAPAAAGGDRTPDGRPLSLPTRARLHELTLDDLETTLDMLTDLLQERTLPSGGKGLVSRMAAPTLYADSALCRRHTQIYWEQFTSGAEALWPVLMFDATGKLPDGILVGNWNAFGSMDECFLVKASLDNETYPDLAPHELQFTGRYVPVTVSPAPAPPPALQHTAAGRRQDAGEGVGAAFIVPALGLPTGVIGLCVPSSCSSGDVQTGLQQLLGDNVTATAYTSQAPGETAELQPADVAVIALLALVGALLLAGTALDVWHGYMADRQADRLSITSVVDSPNARIAQMLHVVEPKPAQMKQRKPPALKTWQRVLVAFSLYTNTKKLLNKSVGKGTLTCVHGIRFFSMTWVLIGHASSMMLSYDQNTFLVLDWFKTPAFQVIANATPSVDTFYLLSGVVLAYTFCNGYKKGKFNIVMFYVHRYLRLTPPLAIMIAITATIFVYFGDGPLWARAVEPTQELCQNGWWQNLLYIQNFWPIEEECLAQSWYLATDMQMFIVSPVILLPLVWKPLWGAIWLGCLTVGFLALRIAIWSVKDLPPTLFSLNVPDYDAAAEMVIQYAYPWMRCTVWLTGIGLGYLLHRLRGRQLTLKPWLWLSGWVAAFAIGVSVIFGMIGYQMPWQEFSNGVAVSYGGLNRFAWGVAVAWLIFACVQGYGGPINTFLSYPGFIPLSRLTYAGYLIHLNVLSLVEYSVKGTVYIDSYRLTYRLLGHVVVTFAAAMLLSLTFEAPFINLEKILFEPKKPAASLGVISAPLVTVPVPPGESEMSPDQADTTSKRDQEAGTSSSNGI